MSCFVFLGAFDIFGCAFEPPAMFDGIVDFHSAQLQTRFNAKMLRREKIWKIFGTRSRNV